jgi:hypothetical protein
VAAGAAAHLPAGGAAQCPGPPLRPPGCCASPAATALRAGLDPGDLCGPWAAETKGQAQGLPPLRTQPRPWPQRMVKTEKGHLPALLQRPVEPRGV